LWFLFLLELRFFIFLTLFFSSRFFSSRFFTAFFWNRLFSNIFFSFFPNRRFSFFS